MRDSLSRLLARSVGGRDVALGLGAMFALRHHASVRGWLEAIALADATDAIALLPISRRLSIARVIVAAAPSLSALAFTRRLLRELRGSRETLAPGK